MSISIPTALCLKATDIDALIQGRMVAAISRSFVGAVRNFALCAADLTDGSTISIAAWAQLEFCRIYQDLADLEKLSKITIWSNTDLQEILQNRSKVIVSCLRIYKLPQPVIVSSSAVKASKIGDFIRLPICLSGDASQPVLDELTFVQRRRQLDKLDPPLHPELEKLQGETAEFAIAHPSAKLLENDIKTFLGWCGSAAMYEQDPDWNWVKTIADVGNSSDGHGFEKLVRKSLIKLGFSNSLNNPKASLDPDSTGGAGGIDFYCDKPYPVVGECKATQSTKVPSSTPSQLMYLGNMHLPEEFSACIKLIVAAGVLTSDANLVAMHNQMNVIRPETLQKLVELKTKHPGSIDLIKLKKSLERPPFGVDADGTLNQVIERIYERLQVRSDLVKSVKELAHSAHSEQEVIEIRVHYNARFAGRNSARKLDDAETKRMLIELASPFAGYLGHNFRIDRYYFLRDFPVVR